MKQYQLKTRLQEFISDGRGKETGKKSLNEVAKSIGVTRQAIANYLGGKTTPDAKILYRLAEYLGVSADYLLGISEIKSADRDIQNAIICTGLNESAINRLAYFTDYEKAEDLKEYQTLCNIIASDTFWNIIRETVSACNAPVSPELYNVDVHGETIVATSSFRGVHKYYATQEFQRLLDEIITISDEQGVE